MRKRENDYFAMPGGSAKTRKSDRLSPTPQTNTETMSRIKLQPAEEQSPNGTERFMKTADVR